MEPLNIYTKDICCEYCKTKFNFADSTEHDKFISIYTGEYDFTDSLNNIIRDNPTYSKELKKYKKRYSGAQGTMQRTTYRFNCPCCNEQMDIDIQTKIIDLLLIDDKLTDEQWNELCTYHTFYDCAEMVYSLIIPNLQVLNSENVIVTDSINK